MEQLKTPNIYELQKEYNIKVKYLNFCRNMACELRKIAENPKISQLDKLRVDGHSKRTDMSDIMAQIIEWEKKAEQVANEIAIYDTYINEMEKILKQFKDRDQLVYFYVKFKGYTKIKAGMSVEPHISERQVYRIIDKIEKKFSKCQNMSLT